MKVVISDDDGGEGTDACTAAVMEELSSNAWLTGIDVDAGRTIYQDLDHTDLAPDPMFSPYCTVYYYPGGSMEVDVKTERASSKATVEISSDGINWVTMTDGVAIRVGFPDWTPPPDADRFVSIRVRAEDGTTTTYRIYKR